MRQIRSLSISDANRGQKYDYESAINSFKEKLIENNQLVMIDDEVSPSHDPAYRHSSSVGAGPATEPATQPNLLKRKVSAFTAFSSLGRKNSVASGLPKIKTKLPKSNTATQNAIEHALHAKIQKYQVGTGKTGVAEGGRRESISRLDFSKIPRRRAQSVLDTEGTLKDAQFLADKLNGLKESKEEKPGDDLEDVEVGEPEEVSASSPAANATTNF